MILWTLIGTHAPAELLLFAVAGALLGRLHFATLRWNTRLFLQPGAAGWAVLMQVLRMGLTTAGLFACARVGVPPLLAALAGLLLARQAAVYRANRRGGATE